MAYQKRELYVTSPIGDLQDEMIRVLKSKEPKIRSDKIKQLVFEPIPMSKIRWVKWFTPIEMEKYLVKLNDFKKAKDEYATTLDNRVDDIDIEGI